MTTGISSIDQTLARIAQIQASFPALAGASTATTSTSGSTFATALASASDTTGTTATTSTTGTSTAGDTASASSGSVTGDQIVASAKKYLGVPYVWGGTTDKGLDCSGLVQKAYGDLGITLPRLSYDQAKVGTSVPDLAHAQPGDILGFGTPAHHVAIYLGNNMMIAAPQEGENVKIQSVYETPASIRRVVGTEAAGTSTTASSSGSGSSAGISAAVQQYSNLFTQAESKYQLPTGLLAAVAQTESAGNPNAVSPAGAQGLMQFMPATAAGLGVNPFQPASAVNGAGQMFSGLLHKYHNSVPLALAAYNAGSGAVDQYGGIPPYAETQNYVRKITALMAGAH